MHGQGAELLRNLCREYAITSLGTRRRMRFALLQRHDWRMRHGYYESPQPGQSQNIRDAPPWAAMDTARIDATTMHTPSTARMTCMHNACEMMACDFASGECEVDLACGTKQDPDGFCRDLCFADDGTCGIDSSCRGNSDEYFCQRMCHDFGGGVLCDQLHCDAYSGNCTADDVPPCLEDCPHEPADCEEAYHMVHDADGCASDCPHDLVEAMWAEMKVPEPQHRLPCIDMQRQAIVLLLAPLHRGRRLPLRALLLRP